MGILIAVLIIAAILLVCALILRSVRAGAVHIEVEDRDPPRNRHDELP